MKHLTARITTGLAAFAVVTLGASSAIAGEVTGNGKDINSPGASICKFSGQNDGEDPPGRTQNFGQDVSHGYIGPTGTVTDPTSLDPKSDEFQSHPGWFCNPNNFDATNL